jgi:hypothetical protein
MLCGGRGLLTSRKTENKRKHALYSSIIGIDSTVLTRGVVGSVAVGNGMDSTVTGWYGTQGLLLAVLELRSPWINR